MNTSTRKMKLNIQGKYQKFWTDLFLKRKIKSLGLKLENLTHHSLHHGELLVVGEELLLWKLIDHTRKPVFFVTLEKVTFQFLE